MGDRAIVLFEDAQGVERFAVYYHWAGRAGVEADARQAVKDHGDRLGDTSYFGARWVGVACASRPGSTGVGLLSVPPEVTARHPEALKKFSHGDAGVAIFNVDTAILRWIEGTGYGFTEQRDPLTLR